MQRTAETSMGLQPLVSQLTDAITTARLHQPDLHSGTDSNVIVYDGFV